MAVASRTDAITSLCVPLPVFLCCNVQVHEQGDRKDGLELNMGLSGITTAPIYLFSWEEEISWRPGMHWCVCLALICWHELLGLALLAQSDADEHSPFLINPVIYSFSKQTFSKHTYSISSCVTGSSAAKEQWPVWSTAVVADCHDFLDFSDMFVTIKQQYW